MSCGSSGRSYGGRQGRFESRFADKFDSARSRVEDEVRNFRGGYTSGNNAFDDYRAATLKRLEDEEREFRAFLDRLRHAKDKSEFDNFMSERRGSEHGDGPTDPQPPQV